MPCRAARDVAGRFPDGMGLGLSIARRVIDLPPVDAGAMTPAALAQRFQLGLPRLWRGKGALRPAGSLAGSGRQRLGEASCFTAVSSRSAIRRARS